MPKQILVVLAAAILSASIVGLARYNLFPEGAEHWTEDWFTLYLSKQLPDSHPDIAVMIVNDETFSNQKQTPWLAQNRPWIGTLLTALAASKPRAIGLDFYYINPVRAETDQAFIETLKSLPAPLVMITVGPDRTSTPDQIAFKKSFLDQVNRPAGHFYFRASEEKLSFGNEAIRYVFHGDTNGAGYPSFTSQIARLPSVSELVKSKKTLPDDLQRIDWLRVPKSGNPVFSRILAHDFMSASPEERARLVQGKIILVGSELKDLPDRHYTPLSIESRRKFAGVTIHAQILAQLLDGRHIYNWPTWAQFLILFAIAVAGIWVGQAARGVWIGVGVGLAGTIVILLISAGLFLLKAPIQANLAIFAWAVALTLGNVFSNFSTPRPALS